MVDKTVNSNVGVNLDPTGMANAAKLVRAEVEKISDKINEAGKNASTQLRAMGAALKKVQTLQNISRAGVFSGNQSFGKQVRSLEEYRRGLVKTADASGVLRSRVAGLNVEFANLGRMGKRPTRNQLLNAQKLEEAANSYSKVMGQVGALRSRIALLSSDGQKAFQPMLANLDAMDKKNQKLFAKNNRSSFGAQQLQIEKATDALRKQVVQAEKLEKSSAARLASLRQEASQLTSLSAIERQAALAGQVRSGQTILRNSSLVGGSVYQRQTDQLVRLDRASRLTNTNIKLLNQELAKPNPGAERLQTLIERHKILQREIGLTIARQNEQAKAKPAAQGGFIGGLKSVKTNLFNIPEGSGVGFGMGALVGRVGAYAAAATAIYGTVSAFKEGITFAIQYQDALAQLQAVSGSTTTEMDRLSKGILQVSKNSANSVLELTKSATIIAQAGFAGSEIESLLQNVVNLSAASGSSTDESVEILTSALGSFQLSAMEATQVTDTLVSALNNSKLSVNQVQLGLQYVGSTAKQSNITFNELVATLGTMADAGIRSGSTMSTGLRQMLIDFIDPSEKLINNLERVGLTTADIDVEVLGLTEVLTRLKDSGFQAYGSLETRAAAAYSVLSNNIDQITKLEQATLRQNAAQEAADVRLDSTSARWQMLLNKLAEVGEQIGEDLTPAFNAIIEVLGIVSISILNIIQAFTGLYSAIVNLGSGLSETAVTAGQYAAALEEAGFSAEEAAYEAMKMGDSLNDVETALKDTVAEIDTLTTEQASLRSEIGKLITRQDDMVGANGNLSETTAKVASEVAVLSSRFPALRAEFAKTQGGIAGLIQAMTALDHKAQITLQNLARNGLAQAQINQTAALKAGGNLTKDFREGKRFGFIPPQYRKDKKFEPALRQFEALMAQNSIASARQAQDLLRNNPSLNSFLGDRGRELNRVVSKYDEATRQLDQFKLQYDQAEFALSKDGKVVTEALIYSSADSTRAASQGSSRGRTAATIKSELKIKKQQLDGLAQEYKDNIGALSIIGEAQSSVSAAISRLTPETEYEKKSGGRTRSGRSVSERRQRDFDRINARIKAEEVEYRKKLFENAVEAFDNAPDLDELQKLLDDVDTSLTEWIGGEAELAIEGIQALKPTSEQRTKMLETAGRKIEELRIEQIDKISDVLSKVITNFVESTSKAIEARYLEATRFTARNLGLAQSRLQGLDNPLESRDTPSYMKTIQQREVEVAQVRADQATMAANARRITEFQELLRVARERKAELEAQLANLGRKRAAETGESEIVVTATLRRESRELRGLSEDLLKLEQDTNELILANERLVASYDVLNERPTTFASGLQMAIKAVRIDVNAASNLGQELINNLDAPLRTLTGTFSDFFRDVISGTVSLGQAFKNMATKIIDAILDMVAVAIANQFFELIMSSVAPGIGGAGRGSVSSISARAGLNAFTGEQIPKRIAGGTIKSGLKTRDSTLVNAAKGEYIVRSSAVDSLGTKFMNDINQRGAAALGDIGGKTILFPTQAPSETNVYVVSEIPPSMGPNDVIATISNDVLKGGITKKLIKRVANGG